LLFLTGWLALGGAASAYLTDTAPHAAPNYDSFQPPAKGQSWNDPVFGSQIKRLSSATATPDDASGGMLTWILNEYSTMAAWNSDNSKLLLEHGSYFALYDGSGNYLRDLPFEIHAAAEPRWSRSNNNVIYYVRGNALKRYDLSTGAMTVQHTFSEYTSITGKGESDISFDGDHFVLAGNNRQIFVYTISSDTKGPVFDTGGRGFDSLYITPNNNVTVSWLSTGTARYTGVELFDGNMVFQRQVMRSGGHMDVTRDTNGAEVIVWTNSNDPTPIQCDNGIVKVRLSDGQQTCLRTFDWMLAPHISCPDQAGFCVVETYAPNEPNPSNWPAYTNELMQVKLDGTETRRLVHHRSRVWNDYNYQPKVSVSRDGSRIVYASNFDLQRILGYASEYSDAYMVVLGASSPTGGGTGGDTGTGGTPPPPAPTGWVRTQQNAGPIYTGEWYDNVNNVHSGGSATLAMLNGDTSVLKFTGTAVRWVGNRDQWAGIAQVYLDGVLVKKVDTYAATGMAQQILYSVEGLTAKQHTLRIYVTGKKNRKAAAPWVWIDAFDTKQ
jgi:hypothetical protein